MEGNLYQLTKSRRGRALAAGLVASCFHQISGGLNHIHSYGYFHRDMKPENLLVTTTGLTDYLTAEALQHINACRANSTPSDGPLPPGPDGRIPARFEKDVSVIVKLADFGLARETTSAPPYTEYVSTRWYRAPEVLLRSREYGAPVDMWALGCILAEMVNLKPLFPGVSEIDQVYRVCEILGDPSPSYGVDERGRVKGGGTWNTGVKLAKNVGFSFPKRKPIDLRTLFDPLVPQSLIDCIADLLRYSPRLRLTSAQCVDHPYFHETIPHLQHTSPLPRIPFSQGQPATLPQPPVQPDLDIAPRSLPPSHSHHQDARPAFANGDMRILPKPIATPENINNRMWLPPGQYRPDMAAASTLVSQLRELDLPTDELASYGHRRPAPGNESFADRPVHSQQYTDGHEQARRASGNMYDGSMYEGSNPSLQHVPAPNHDHRSDRPTPPSHVAAYVQQQQQMALDPTHQHEMYMPPPIEPTPNASRTALPITGKKKKWGLSSVFGGGDKSTTNLAQSTNNLMSTTSLKRTQSGHQTTERLSPAAEVALPPLSDDPKKAKKEAAQRAKDLEMAKREAAARAQKERARAVMQKRNQLVGDRSQTKARTDIEFGTGDNVNVGPVPSPHGALGPAGYSAASLHRHAPVSSSRLAPSGTNMSATASTPNFPSAPRTYASMPPSASLSSIRSLDSGQSHQSGQDPLSADKLAAYDISSRSKARRRNDDYDHSESDRASLQSRSVLTIGTIDSE
jgi:meiosis induction protein kinase IME2/SME1